MTSGQRPISLSEKIAKHLPLVEKILLTALVIGVILTVMKMDSTVARVSLLGLGVTFFLFAYRPIDIQPNENEQFGFPELLGYTIVPKMLWISSAVSALGVRLYLLENKGYKQILMIGGLSILMGTLLLGFFLVSGVKHIKLVMPVLLRAVPLCFVDFYILLK